MPHADYMLMFVNFAYFHIYGSKTALISLVPQLWITNPSISLIAPGEDQ